VAERLCAPLFEEEIMLARFSDIDRTFAMMDHLRRRMDRVFDEFEPRGRDSLRANLAEEAERFWARNRYPRMLLSDGGAELVLRAELPGLSEKDIQLSIHQDVLSISGERKSDAPEGYVVHRQERPPVRFARSFTLPCKIDPEKVTARLKNGVLTITMTKAAESQPRQISIKAE